MFLDLQSSLMSTAALATIRWSPSSLVVLSGLARDIIQPESCFNYWTF